MLIFIKLLARAVAVLCGLLLVLGMLGAWLPVGDSFAVIRMPLCALLAVSVLFTRWPKPVSRGVAILALGLMLPLFLPLFPTDVATGVKLYQKNMLFKNREVEGLAADIERFLPDFVTLQELSDDNRPVVEKLSESHPYRAECPFTRWAATAVLSRWPIGEQKCEPGLTAVQVQMGDDQIWVVSLHLHWPWPYGQASHLDQIEPTLASLDGPVLIGGDFNMVPWSYTMRRSAALTRTRRVGRTDRTIVKNGLPLPIDHVLAPGGGTIEIRPKLGSDHYGVLAEVSIR